MSAANSSKLATIKALGKASIWWKSAKRSEADNPENGRQQAKRSWQSQN